MNDKKYRRWFDGFNCTIDSSCFLGLDPVPEETCMGTIFDPTGVSMVPIFLTWKPFKGYIMIWYPHLSDWMKEIIYLSKLNLASCILENWQNVENQSSAMN